MPRMGSPTGEWPQGFESSQQNDTMPDPGCTKKDPEDMMQDPEGLDRGQNRGQTQSEFEFWT